jgi:hypothetical protein
MLGASDSFPYIQERGNDDLVNFTVTTPQLASDVTEASVEYLEFNSEWFFASFVEGSGITSGMLIPPNEAPIPLTMSPDDEFEFEDGPFISEAAVRAVHPPTSGAGKYVFVVDGGERFYSADFNPGSPDGNITLVSPMDSATVSSTPSFTISNLCTNCTSQFISVESLANDGVDIRVLSLMSPFPPLINFGDFGPNSGSLGNPLTELPAGDYDVELDTTVETVIAASFTPADPFNYFAATFREDAATITVPEPGVLLAQLFAGLTLLGLRRARRR